MAGIVLSGGENRRMGADKAFLRLSGVPLIEHVLRALRSVSDRVIIVTNSPAAYSSYGMVVVPDAFDKRGPLTGIYSGLRESTDEYNIVVACDMPFLNPGLLSYMLGLAGGHDIVVPSVGDFIEPLHAVYRKGLVPVIEQRLRKDARQIQGLFDEIRTRYVTAEEIDRFDPGRRSFVNLNTPEEYERYREGTCSD